MEDSPEDSSSSAPASPSQLTWAGAWEVSAGWPCPVWPGSLSIASRVGSCLHHSSCGCARLVSRRTAVFSVCSQPCDHMLHTGTKDSSTEEHGCIPAAHGQRSGARERARSRSPQWGQDLRSWLVDTTDYEHARERWRTAPPHCVHAARDEAAAGPSDSRSHSALAPSAALEQTLLRQRERSRSPRQGCDLRSEFMDAMEYDPSAGRRRRRRRKRRRRRRVLVPWRLEPGKHSGHCGGDWQESQSWN